MNTDGNKIASYKNDATLNLKSQGRMAVYAIIATAWTISFSNGQFTPTTNILWSLVLAISYIFLDILYFLLSSLFYSHLLTKYFNSTKDGDFKYKNENTKITKRTKYWMLIGLIWTCFMSILLLVSFIFMFLEIVCNLMLCN